MHALSCHHGDMTNQPEDTSADPEQEFSDDSIEVPLVDDMSFEVTDVIPSGMGPLLTRPIPDHVASPVEDAFALTADMDGEPVFVTVPEPEARSAPGDLDGADEPSESWPTPDRSPAPEFEPDDTPALESPSTPAPT